MRFILVGLYIIQALLTIFELCMFLRAILSWIPSMRGSKLYQFTSVITEPAISPIRDLLMRFEWVRRFPFDISFIIVWLILSAIMGFVQNLIYIFL